MTPDISDVTTSLKVEFSYVTSKHCIAKIIIRRQITWNTILNACPKSPHKWGASGQRVLRLLSYFHCFGAAQNFAYCFPWPESSECRKNWNDLMNRRRDIQRKPRKSSEVTPVDGKYFHNSIVDGKFYALPCNGMPACCIWCHNVLVMFFIWRHDLNALQVRVDSFLIWI